jgi:hypothetical protein
LTFRSIRARRASRGDPRGRPRGRRREADRRGRRDLPPARREDPRTLVARRPQDGFCALAAGRRG